MASLTGNIRASTLEYLATGIGVLINLAVIRHLGAEQYGVYSYCLSIIGMLASVLGMGCMDQVFLRETAQGQPAQLMTWAMFWLRATGAALILAGVLIYSLVFGRPQEAPLGLLLIAWSSSSIFLRDAFRMPLVAAQEIGRAVRIGLVFYLFGWSVRLAAVGLNAPMPVFLAIFGCEGLVGGAAYYLAWHRDRSRQIPIAKSLDIAFKLVRRCWPLLVTAGAVTAFMRIDQVLLFHLMDARSTGIYGSMIWLMERLFFLSGIVMGSFFPYLSHAQAHDPAWYERSLRVGYKVMALTAIPVAFACSLYPGEILGLFLSHDFAGGETAFAVLVWALPFIFWGALNQKHLLIHHRLKTDMAFATLSAVLNLGLNLWLIPLLGLRGAAIASVAGHGLYFLLQWFLPGLRRNSQYILVSLIVPLAACLVSAWLVSWLPFSGIPAAAVFIGIYGALVLLLCLGPLFDDYAAIGRQIRRASGLAPEATR